CGIGGLEVDAMVETTGFEPATPPTPRVCATRLRHVSTCHPAFPPYRPSRAGRSRQDTKVIISQPGNDAQAPWAGNGLRPYLIASLSALPGRNAGTLPAGISISAPVCGLRPRRADRSRTSKLPKPT